MIPPDNCSGITIDGTEYKIDSELNCEVPNELIGVAVSHGFKIHPKQAATITIPASDNPDLTPNEHEAILASIAAQTLSMKGE